MKPSSMKSATERRVGRFELVADVAATQWGHLSVARIALGEEKGRLVLLRRVERAAGVEEGFLRRARDACQVAMGVHDSCVLALVEVRLGTSLVVAYEYVVGVPLRSVMERAASAHQPLPLPFVLRIVADLLGCMERGKAVLLGRSVLRPLTGITPDLVMLTGSGEVLIGDLGLATLDRVPQTPEQMDYRCPEARRSPVDGALPEPSRSEVYAAGSLLWELLSGSAIGEGGRLEAFQTSLVSGTADPPEHLYPPRCDAGIRGLLRRAVHPDPKQRFAGPAAMLQQIGRLGNLASSEEVARQMDALFGQELAERRRQVEDAWATTGTSGKASWLPTVRPPGEGMDSGRDLGLAAQAAELSEPGGGEKRAADSNAGVTQIEDKAELRPAEKTGAKGAPGTLPPRRAVNAAGVSMAAARGPARGSERSIAAGGNTPVPVLPPEAGRNPGVRKSQSSISGVPPVPRARSSPPEVGAPRPAPGRANPGSIGWRGASASRPAWLEPEPGFYPEELPTKLSGEEVDSGAASSEGSKISGAPIKEISAPAPEGWWEEAETAEGKATGEALIALSSEAPTQQGGERRIEPPPADLGLLERSVPPPSPVAGANRIERNAPPVPPVPPAPQPVPALVPPRDHRSAREVRAGLARMLDSAPAVEAPASKGRARIAVVGISVTALVAALAFALWNGLLQSGVNRLESKLIPTPAHSAPPATGSAPSVSVGNAQPLVSVGSPSSPLSASSPAVSVGSTAAGANRGVDEVGGKTSARRPEPHRTVARAEVRKRGGGPAAVLTTPVPVPNAADLDVARAAASEAVSPGAGAPSTEPPVPGSPRVESPLPGSSSAADSAEKAPAPPAEQPSPPAADAPPTPSS